MSKRLLMNNVTSQIIDNKCPLCNNSESSCTCTAIEVDTLHIDWAIAGKYAGFTSSHVSHSTSDYLNYSTSTGGLGLDRLFYTTTAPSGTTLSKMETNFKNKMTELGYTNSTSSKETMYYYVQTSTFYSNYIKVHWNDDVYGVPNVTLFKTLLDLTEGQLQQIKEYGKYAYVCKLCGEYHLEADCPNVDYEKELTQILLYEYAGRTSFTDKTSSYLYFTVNGVETKYYTFYTDGNSNETMRKAFEAFGWKKISDKGTTTTDKYFVYASRTVYLLEKPNGTAINYLLQHQDLLD